MERLEGSRLDRFNEPSVKEAEFFPCELERSGRAKPLLSVL